VKLGKVTFPPETWKAVSEEAKALIHKLLAFDPTVRYTAEQALNDEWITQVTPRPSDVSLGNEFMESLQSFKKHNWLKKAALNIIAGLIDEEQINPSAMYSLCWTTTKMECCPFVTCPMVWKKWSGACTRGRRAAHGGYGLRWQRQYRLH